MNLKQLHFLYSLGHRVCDEISRVYAFEEKLLLCYIQGITVWQISWLFLYYLLDEGMNVFVVFIQLNFHAHNQGPYYKKDLESTHPLDTTSMHIVHNTLI